MAQNHSFTDIAAHFCRLAGEIISIREFLTKLAEHGTTGETLSSPRFGSFFTRMNDFLIDGWFLSVGRLHDPAGINGQNNISVEYILKHGQFSAPSKTELDKLNTKMQSFANIVKSPRNKLLAHNDVCSIITMGNMGIFYPNEDAIYIDALRKFAYIVSQECLREPFVYDDLLPNDVDAVVSVLAAGLRLLSQRDAEAFSAAP